jgi:hypothetical protein
MSEDEPTDEQREPSTDHLNGVGDGCGCTEIWEHLSEEREANAD